MQLLSSSYNHSTLADNPQNSCEQVITNALQSCSKELSCNQMKAGDSLTDVSEGCQCIVVVL